MSLLPLYYFLHHLFLSLMYKLVCSILSNHLLQALFLNSLTALFLKDFVRRSGITWWIKIRFWLRRVLFGRFPIDNSGLISTFWIKYVFPRSVPIYNWWLDISDFTLSLQLEGLLILIRFIRLVRLVKVVKVERFFKFLILLMIICFQMRG